MTRLYVCSDLHAAERAWRKLLNATAADLYRADAVLIAGDLTGKAIVPIVRNGDTMSAEVLGSRRVARDEHELVALEREIADLGYYSFVADAEEVARIGRDDDARRELFARLMEDRLVAWLTLANERLAASDVPVYLMPGNDDEFGIDPVLNRSGWRTVNADERVLDLPGGLRLASLGWSSPTPWHTPREMGEEEFLDRISDLLDGEDPARTVLMTHVPPYRSGLDTAPLLDPSLRPTVSAGDVLRGPVGSHGVRAAIERFRPLLGVHGHIHESGGEARVGGTLCLNAGSEANHGVLRGYIVDIEPDGPRRWLRVEG